MKTDLLKFTFLFLALAALCMQTTSCIFESRRLVGQDTSRFQEMRLRDDSMLRAKAAHRRKMQVHPFEIESGHIIFLAQQKSGDNYSTVRTIEFSFEQFGKVQLYEEKFSGYDIKTMKSKDVYTLKQIKNDTQIVVLNPNSKKKFYTSQSVADFNFVFDSTIYVQAIKPVTDTLAGITLYRYDLKEEKKSMKAIGGLLLFESRANGGFVLKPYEIEWNYKIPEEKLQVPDEYQ